MSFARLGAILLLGILSVPGVRAAAPCAAERVTVLEDSHGLGPFGELLDRWLATLPETEFRTYALGGSSAPWWLWKQTSHPVWSRQKTTPGGLVYESCGGTPVIPREGARRGRVASPDIGDLMAENAGTYRREVVIIAQGSNVPGEPSVYEEWGSKLVRAAISRPGTLCIWIGPPRMRARTESYMDQVYGAIRDGIARAGREIGAPESACRLVDSRAYSAYPATGGDGVHYPFTPEGWEAARRWTDGVIREIDSLIR